MPDLTPEQIVEKQIKRVQNAVGDYRDGVRRTKKQPMQRAIAAIGKMRNNFNEAIDSGKVQEGFESVSDAEWKEATATKGGDRLAKGMEQARPKLLEFQQQIKPFRDALKQQIDSMPSETFEQRMARMNANATGMHEFKFRKRRRN